MVSVDRDAGEFAAGRACNLLRFKRLHWLPRARWPWADMKLVPGMGYSPKCFSGNGLCNASMSGTPTHHRRTRRRIVKERSVLQRQLD